MVGYGHNIARYSKWISYLKIIIDKRLLQFLAVFCSLKRVGFMQCYSYCRRGKAAERTNQKKCLGQKNESVKSNSTGELNPKHFLKGKSIVQQLLLMLN